MPIWDDVIPGPDKQMFAKAGMGGTVGFGERPAVVVVDMTYGFADSRYPLGSGEVGEPVARAIRRLLEEARSRKVPIFFTVPAIFATAAHRGRWKTTTGLAPSEPGLPGPSKIVEVLEPMEGETIIEKLRPSAFFCTDLVNLLVFHEVDTLIVTGMVTSGCVRATVVDAFSYNYRVIIPEECCGDRAVVSHKVNLFDMHMKYADVLSLSEVEQYLGRLSCLDHAVSPSRFEDHSTSSGQGFSWPTSHENVARPGKETETKQE
ncbi:MAG: isochorismatase family protein [Dehalococcoidia bacterium]|nr:isochorismatase family protein [Dehalococcoidia bacterium]